MDIREYAFLLDSGNRRARNSSNDFRFSTRQYCPARTSHRYLPRSTNRVSRSASFCRSHARISSILVRTKRARLRLSFGGIGGYLINKFVKQTKINSWLAHKGGFDEIDLVEAKPNEGKISPTSFLERQRCTCCANGCG